MVSKQNIDTICVHGETASQIPNPTGSISVPIYQSATFAHPGVGESTGYDYSRLQNPTRQELERVVADLEGGVDALAFSSGMAAISTCFELFSPGDHILVTDDMYGGTIRLLDTISTKNGLEISYVNTGDLKLVSESIRPNTAGILVETPTNPMMHVTDLEEISALAKAQNALLMVDNTFLTPYLQRPIPLGADIVIHSGTKYLSGHNDTLSGFLVTGREDISERLRFLIKTTGAGLAPFDSWLTLRGIKTLAVRMEKHQSNAIEVAQFLLVHPKVTAVYYIGLESHPAWAITQKQCSGYGGMISFSVDSEKTAHRVLRQVKLIRFAESLGGVESLITYPMYQTHADVPLEKRLAQGIDQRLLRLSVGIENTADLIRDLQQALADEEA